MERRKFKRVPLAPEEGASCLFTFKNKSDEPVQAKIMDISEGGTHIAYKRRTKIVLTGDDIIYLKDVKGIPPLVDMNIEVKIKWILNVNYLEHIGAGCEFRNLTDAVKSHLHMYISNR